MNTIPFGPRNPKDDPLLAKAAELPKDVAPSRDLWPSISARLAGEPQQARPRAFGWPAALAAGFVVASVSALLTWGLMRDTAPVAPGTLAGGAAVDTAIMPVNYGPNSGLTAGELLARDELLVAVPREIRAAEARDARRDREEPRGHPDRGQRD